MIHEQQYLDGTISGKVMCGNPACRRVLQTYQGAENAPGLWDSVYLLMKAEERLFFVGPDGLPIPSLPLWRAHQAGADIKFVLAGRSVGYRLIPGSTKYAEDFCSDSCASEYLSRNPQFSLCVRRKTQDTIVFVAQASERFSTRQVTIH